MDSSKCGPNRQGLPTRQGEYRLDSPSGLWGIRPGSFRAGVSVAKYAFQRPEASSRVDWMSPPPMKKTASREGERRPEGVAKACRWTLTGPDRDPSC